MKRSTTADLAVLNRVRRIVEAGIVDLPAMLPALHDARDGGYPGRRLDGSPSGKGGHRDLSDRLRFDPAGNVVSQDPAERDLAEIGAALKLLMDGAVRLRAVQTRTFGDRAEPTNLCRGGACPSGGMAARGCAGRCHACHQAWYRSASNPGERAERDTVGRQTKMAC